MKYQNTRRGFTLIELLIVVLIVGILAAVAVPQYQKAIAKSRATEAFVIIKALCQAQEVYYLANGKYSTNLHVLDVSIPTNQVSSTWFGSDSTRPYTYLYSCLSPSGACAGVASDREKMPVIHSVLVHNTTSDYAGLMLCTSNAKNNLAAQICRSMSIDGVDIQGETATGSTYKLN